MEREILHHQCEVQGIMCYGELLWDSNFQVVCEEEEDDCVWVDGNVETGKSFESWEDVITVMKMHLDGDIQEVSAI